jgi:hypothetical protein
MTVPTTIHEPNGYPRSAPKTGADDASGFKALTLDVELYQSFIDDPAMSDADKRDLIETLWSIMVSCVDLGFGIHPLQHPELGADFAACGQNADLPKVKRDKSDTNRVSSSDLQQCDQDRAESRCGARHNDS